MPRLAASVPNSSFERTSSAALRLPLAMLRATRSSFVTGVITTLNSCVVTSMLKMTVDTMPASTSFIVREPTAAKISASGT